MTDPKAPEQLPAKAPALFDAIASGIEGLPSHETHLFRPLRMNHSGC